MATRQRPNRWGSELWPVVGACLVAAVTVWVQTRRPPNTLAAALLQGGTLIFTIYASYVFGKVSARRAADDLNRSRAKSPFRRMQTLYRAMERQRQSIEEVRHHLARLQLGDGNARVLFDSVDFALTHLDRIVVEHIATGEDALSDWRDVAPDEVAEIERRALQLGDEG